MKKILMPKSDSNLQQELLNLIVPNGFTDTGNVYHDGQAIYTRKWEREVDVAFYGPSISYLDIMVTVRYGSTIVWVSGNCGVNDGVRRYSSPGRAVNAIKVIVDYQGFEY